MKKSMIKTIAAFAVLGLASNAQATTYNNPPQDPSTNVTVGDITKTVDSNNTKTDTKTTTSTDTKTVGDITKNVDSNNSSVDTKTSTSTSTKTSTSTDTKNVDSGNTNTVTSTDMKTDTKTVGDITKTANSNNTSTADSNNTKSVDSFNTSTSTVDVTKTTTVDVTKNIAKADDASVATSAGGSANVTANITSLNVKDGAGAIVGGNANVAFMEGNMQVDPVHMGGVTADASTGAQASDKGYDSRSCQKPADTQAAAATNNAYAMSNIMTGNVADGIGLNAGNIYQLTSAPSATAVNGNYNISSTRGNN